MRKAIPPQPDFLAQLTGHDRAWWFARIQKAVSDSGIKTGGAHDEAQPIFFLSDVIREVVQTLPREGMYDPNMRSALVTSYVLGLWYFRLHRAKCWHPARPLEVRRAAYDSWLRNVREFSTLWVDERDDHAFMPQPYDNPFLPGAKSGKFV